jgi:uncharacterized membrane protein
MKNVYRAIVLLMTIPIFSCQYEKEDEILTEISPEAPEISFINDVKPIIDNSCLQCHNGSQFPDLRTYESIYQNTGKIKSEVVARTMPIGGSLTSKEIQAISDWIDSGAKDN